MDENAVQERNDQLVRNAAKRLGSQLTSEQYQLAIEMLSELPKDSEQLDYLVETIVRVCAGQT